MKDVDLGVCGGQLHPGDPDRAAVILPGARYVPAAPLLWFTGHVLEVGGWTILQVWDNWDQSVDAKQWAEERFSAALNFVGPVPGLLIVAKSLTTLALPAAAQRGLPGIWLTPLLNQPALRSGLQAITAPTLLVGGAADPTWDAELVANLPSVEVVEIPGADHSLGYSDDPLASIDTLRTVVQEVSRFVDRLP